MADHGQAEDLLSTIERLPPGLRPPFLDGQALRFRARLAPTADAADSGFTTAINRFRELPFWLAVTLLEHGEWLGEQGRSDEAEPLVAEAREIFERLEAAPWLERADAARPALARIGTQTD
jgi:hypothetical protein